MLRLDPDTTALILVDLQQGVIPIARAPRSGGAAVDAAIALAGRFRKAGAPVILVHVDFAQGVQPSRNVDQPGFPPEGTPADYSDFAPGLRQDGDIIVLKHHWGAFTGTDLDLHLRRRNCRTVVIGGLVTNFAVESTARSAWEASYDVIVAEDVTAGVLQKDHDFSIRRILPNIARVIASDDIQLLRQDG